MNWTLYISIRKVVSCFSVFFFVFQANFALAVQGEKNLRIAVLGAGAAGLTAAYSLKKQGFSNVIVFEKENRVGGKVESHLYAGRPIELGAVWISHDYTLIREMAKELGVTFQNYVIPKVIAEKDGTRSSFESYFLRNYSPSEILSSISSFHSLEKKYSSVWDHGFVNASPDLYANFDSFSKQNGIRPIADLFEPFFVACGYGYYKEVPAIYILKLLRMMLRVLQYDLIGKIPLTNLSGLQTIEGGFQGLWEKLAVQLNVQLNSEITGIKRRDTDEKPLIEVTVGGRTEEFDRVVSSIPLQNLSQILDISKEEERLFGKVETYDYWITIFHEKNLQGGQTLFLKESTQPESIGNPIVLANGIPGSDLWITYQLAEKGWEPSYLEKRLHTGIEELGGKVKKIAIQKKWEYFPHVKAADLQDGFYQKLESMQGQNGLYYIGGIMNFETTEHTAEFAKDLIERKFK